MRALNTKDGDEHAENWKRVVSALWTLNHVNAGLRSVQPRLEQIQAALDELEAALASTEESSTKEIIRRELSDSLARHSQFAEALISSTERIGEMLARMEESDASEP